MHRGSMARMRDTTSLALRRAPALLLLSLTAACSTTLVNQRIEQRGGGWTITLLKLTDGPDTYSYQNFRYEPGDDEKFLRATIEVRNDANVPRAFNYDRCDLDAGHQRLLPSLVDRDWVLNALADDVEDYDPGETKTRVLIFSYPEDQLPTRLACGEAVIALPLR